jgi:hypothetical protein
MAPHPVKHNQKNKNNPIFNLLQFKLCHKLRKVAEQMLFAYERQIFLFNYLESRVNYGKRLLDKYLVSYALGEDKQACSSSCIVSISVVRF